MAQSGIPELIFKSLLCVLVAAAMMPVISCTKPIDSRPDINQTKISTLNESSPCIDVQGHVLGRVIPGSRIYLYAVVNHSYPMVMKIVRHSIPLDIGTVNETDGFAFTCLGYGKFVAAIPSSSYANSSVGSPITDEFETGNGTIFFVFQGGDCEYLVGAFSINKTHQAQP